MTGTHLNRTGIRRKPNLSEHVQEGNLYADLASDTETPDAEQLRSAVMAEAGAVGSRSDQEQPVEERKAELLDLLGARAAFERGGTRLYDALAAKAKALGSFDGGPSVDELLEIRAEEVAHLRMLVEVITELGGDPTMVTPTADLEGVMAGGLIKVVNDPRTSVADCLHAMIVAELSDNECWATLAAAAAAEHRDDLAERFRHALSEEQEHLRKVRGWLKQSHLATAETVR
jgi:rubrerythrin